jgi:CubicO group peptidase (beta-lactamase class C family)
MYPCLLNSCRYSRSVNLVQSWPLTPFALPVAKVEIVAQNMAGELNGYGPVDRASPLENLRKLQYGYLWWSIAYPYKDKTLRAFFAGGNGGQLVMGIPDLGLVVAIYAANYSDPVLYKIQEELVPSTFCPRSRVKNRFDFKMRLPCSCSDLWTKSLRARMMVFLRPSNLGSERVR